MKRILIILAALALTSPAALQAQNVQWLTASIPFDFYVGNTLLPAGEYVAQTTSYGTVLVVRGKNEPGNAVFAPLFFTTKRSVTAGPHYMLFNKYASDRIFLSQVWREDMQPGVMLPISRREREAVTSRLISGQRREEIVIQARR